jgi:hypothetical protein
MLNVDFGIKSAPRSMHYAKRKENNYEKNFID